MAGTGHRGPRQGDFRLARIAAASALIGVLIFILSYDALSADYQVDSIVITALLGTIGTLLGIEGLAEFRRSPPPTPPNVMQATYEEVVADEE